MRKRKGLTKQNKKELYNSLLMLLPYLHDTYPNSKNLLRITIHRHGRLLNHSIEKVENDIKNALIKGLINKKGLLLRNSNKPSTPKGYIKTNTTPILHLL